MGLTSVMDKSKPSCNGVGLVIPEAYPAKRLFSRNRTSSTRHVCCLGSASICICGLDPGSRMYLQCAGRKPKIYDQMESGLTPF
jgi:hypothetical protein